MGTNCRWNHLLRLEDFLFHWFIDWNTYYCEFKDDVWRRMPSCYLVIYMHQSISDKETDVGSRSKPGQLGFRKSRSDGRERKWHFLCYWSYHLSSFSYLQQEFTNQDGTRQMISINRLLLFLKIFFIGLSSYITNHNWDSTIH